MLVALLTAVAGSPASVRSAEIAKERDFSTVGRIVARKVDGRTVVVVPVAGPLRARLSEPVRVGNHWRLYLTIADARMSIRGTGVKNPEGVIDLKAIEDGNDVRITIDVRELGDYGARPSEEGYLLWIDSQARTPVADADAPMKAEAAVAGGNESAVTAQGQPGNRTSRTSLVLIGLAAVAGLAVRHVRRNGVPDWAEAASNRVPPKLRELLVGPARMTSGKVEGSADPVRTPSVRDPRGRSAEIGDAFRVEPETPPSGIAGLGSASGTNER